MKKIRVSLHRGSLSDFLYTIRMLLNRIVWIVSLPVDLALSVLSARFILPKGVTWRNERFTNKTPEIIRLCPTNEGQKLYHTSLKVTSKHSFQIGLMGPESLRLHLQSHYLKLSVTSRENLFMPPPCGQTNRHVWKHNLRHSVSGQ